MNLKNFYFIAISFSFLFVFTLSSCSDDTRKKMDITPMAYGNIDNIYLVSDDYFWNSAIGDTFKNQFEALYPITPQPEPLFDIRYVNPEKFNKVLKTHRAVIIMADLSDKENVATKLVYEAIGEKKLKKAFSDKRYRIAIQKNRWAMGQVVVYWFAPNREELLETVSKDYKQVIRAVNDLDSEKLLKMVYADGLNQRVMEDIKKKYGIEMQIPQGFRLAHQDSSTIWLFEETTKVSNNIMIHSIKNADYKTISRDSIIAIRNRVSKKYFSSWSEGSYMVVDNENMPIFFQEMVFGGLRSMQARGIWRMEKDFMGGPFVSYLIPNPKEKTTLLIDAFVYAPGQKKRPEMRKLDAVFSTFKFL